MVIEILLISIACRIDTTVVLFKWHYNKKPRFRKRGFKKYTIRY